MKIIKVLKFENFPDAEEAVNHNTVTVVEQDNSFFKDEEDYCHLHCTLEIANILQEKGIATIVKKEENVVSLVFEGMLEDFCTRLEDCGVQFKNKEDIKREKEEIWNEMVCDIRDY